MGLQENIVSLFEDVMIDYLVDRYEAEKIGG